MTRQFSQGVLSIKMSVDGKVLENDYPDQIRVLFENDSIKEIRAILQPLILCGSSAKTITGLPEGFLPEDRPFRLKEMEVLNGVAHLHFVREHRKNACSANA